MWLKQALAALSLSLDSRYGTRLILRHCSSNITKEMLTIGEDREAKF